MLAVKLPDASLRAVVFTPAVVEPLYAVAPNLIAVASDASPVKLVA